MSTEHQGTTAAGEVKPASHGAPPHLDARQQFRALTLLNPNHFGNLAGSALTPALSLERDATYEELMRVGYHAGDKRLAAVIRIKQSIGYGGDVRRRGSREHVRFYVSYDNGATWRDAGMTTFTVYDVPHEAPIDFATSLRFDPSSDQCSSKELLLRVRAILSWNAPPPAGTPDYTPVWGNALDASMQRDIFRLEPPKKTTAAPGPLALYGRYQGRGLPWHLPGADDEPTQPQGPAVPPQRFLAPYVHAELAKSAGAGPLAVEVTRLVEPKVLKEIVDSFLSPSADTRYEELELVGVDPNQSLLIGSVRVKLPSGYSGDPCGPGSQEYVAFWIDWHDGTGLHHVGTTSVRVYDIKTMPQEGADYAVFVPVDLLTRRKPSEQGPMTATVRAILSWQREPPSTDPDFIPVWGNRVQTLVHIPPGKPAKELSPILASVGDIAVRDIDALGLVQDSYALQGGLYLDDSPFGGRIDIAGKIAGGTAATRYRVMRAKRGSGAFFPLTNEPDGIELSIIEWSWAAGLTQRTVTAHADAQGYYIYEDHSPTHFVERSILASWYTGSNVVNGAYDLRVDVSVDGDPAHDIHGDVVTVQLDNSLPTAIVRRGLSPGDDACRELQQGEVLRGGIHAWAGYEDHAHFGAIQFVIQPAAQAGGATPVLTSPYHATSYPAQPDWGIGRGMFELDTTPMAPCSYSLTLHVRDRANVDSGRDYHRSQSTMCFCVRAKGGAL